MEEKVVDAGEVENEEDGEGEGERVINGGYLLEEA